jgi:CDP-diacylglycerol--glycerol-3-phosphate 3-phosphatidyltransferase
MGEAAPVMTTANKITITRILMIPLFVMMAVYYGKSVQRGDPQRVGAFSRHRIFLLAAASDGIDGYIARRYNQRSQLGVVLDPIADKGLLLAAIITLSFSKWDYEFPALVSRARHHARRGHRRRHAHAAFSCGKNRR